jgi:hypothetical protein
MNFSASLSPPRGFPPCTFVPPVVKALANCATTLPGIHTGVTILPYILQHLTVGY